MERCVRSAGGCAVRCVREGEKRVWVRMGRRGLGDRMWMVRREVPAGARVC